MIKESLLTAIRSRIAVLRGSPGAIRSRMVIAKTRRRSFCMPSVVTQRDRAAVVLGENERRIGTAATNRASSTYVEHGQYIVATDGHR